MGANFARPDVIVSVAPFHGVDNVGEMLLSLAVERDVDLIVMGGFGQSRIREVLLGGVTLTVMRSMR